MTNHSRPTTPNNRNRITQLPWKTHPSGPNIDVNKEKPHPTPHTPQFADEEKKKKITTPYTPHPTSCRNSTNPTEASDNNSTIKCTITKHAHLSTAQEALCNPNHSTNTKHEQGAPLKGILKRTHNAPKHTTTIKTVRFDKKTKK